MKKISIYIILIIMVISMTGCNNEKKNGKVTEIKTHVSSGEDAKHYMTVTGLDKNSDTIWEYTTDKVYVAQGDNLEYFKSRNNIVYLNVDGTIIALDKQTGKELWQNDEYKGSSSYYIIDEDNNLFLTNWLSPVLFIVNEDGYTVRNIKSINDRELVWPSGINIESNERLVISYPKTIDETELTFEIAFYLDDLLNTKAKILDKIVTPEFEHYQIVGFEEVKKFELNTDGELYVSFKPESELGKQYTQQKVLVTSNVKNIYPVMVGSTGEGQLLIIGTNGSAKFIDSYDLSEGLIKLREYKVSDIDYAFTLKMYDGINFGFININNKVIDDFYEKR